MAMTQADFLCLHKSHGRSFRLRDSLALPNLVSNLIFRRGLSLDISYPSETMTFRNNLGMQHHTKDVELADQVREMWWGTAG
jgi:hypothetical protein